MKELFSNFIKIKELDNLSDKSIFFYKECFKYFNEFYNSDNLCSDVTSNTILEYIGFMKKHKDINDITINTRLRGLTSFVRKRITLH